MIFPARFLVLEEYKSWRACTNDILSSPYCSLQSAPVLLCGCAVPDHDGGVQDKFNDCSVELDQRLLWQTKLPQLPQKIHPLLGFFEDGVNDSLPLQVFRKFQESSKLERSQRLTLSCWKL